MTLEYLTVAACEELAVGADQVNEASTKTKDKDASTSRSGDLSCIDVERGHTQLIVFHQIERVRKMPNTRLRRDREVAR